MNENEKKVSSPEIEENQKFKQAIASKNEIIRGKDNTIKTLQDDLGNAELANSALIKERDMEKSLRIKAERIVDNSKKLEATGHEMYAPPKSKAEKFSEQYLKAREELKNKN